MKAIDLLEIVNEQCTPNESYQIYRNFGRNILRDFNDDELSQFMKGFFVGNDGVVISIDHELLRESDGLVVVYPTIEADELYHDFMPISEQSLFIGLLDNDQLVYIFNLE